MELKYFDNAATTRVKKEVLEEMLPYFHEKYGNPSSLYSIGRASKKAMEDARKKVANLINANPNEIYFTGCGSESDNTIIKGIAHTNRKKGKHIITSQIEHPAVLHTCQALEKQGFEITYLKVSKNGFIDIEELRWELMRYRYQVINYTHQKELVLYMLKMGLHLKNSWMEDIKKKIKELVQKM